MIETLDARSLGDGGKATRDSGRGRFLPRSWDGVIPSASDRRIPLLPPRSILESDLR